MYNNFIVKALFEFSLNFEYMHKHCLKNTDYTEEIIYLQKMRLCRSNALRFTCFCAVKLKIH